MVLTKPPGKDLIPDRSNLFESHWSNQWLTQNRVIDITIGLKEWRCRDEIRQILVANGYEDFDQAGVPERVYFRCRVPRAFNVHVVRYAGVHWVNNLALRGFSELILRRLTLMRHRNELPLNKALE